MNSPARKVLSVTGSRADWGLMKPVHDALAQSPDFDLQLVVTGMHLMADFAQGLETVVREFSGPIHYTEAPKGVGTGLEMGRTLGLMLVDMAEIVHRAGPDIVLLQGDRGEMLAAALAAVHQNIAVVHMSGGDTTGTIDDSLRHAVSKLAHIHLTTCAQSSARLRAMGEDPRRIFEVGEPGLDVIRSTALAPREELFRRHGLDPQAPVLLGTLHPVTTEAEQAEAQMNTFLDALANLGLQAMLTYPNTDAGGAAMVRALEARRDAGPWRIVKNLGMREYLSFMAQADVVVGNSSSGILEAPSFRVPVVNIGTRQQGRLRAANIVDAPCETRAIVGAVRHVLADEDFRQGLRTCENPYGDGHAAERTLKVLSRLRLIPEMVAKWLPGEEPLIDGSI